MRRLAKVVDVLIDGENHCFTPADNPLPEWAVAAIVNPDVWADDGPDVGAPPAPVKERKERPAPVTAEDPVADLGDVDFTDDDMDEVSAANYTPTRPRGNGPKADWIEYAEALGFTVPASASRDDIIAMIDAKES